MAKNKQSGLGRGIEALFEENDFNEISDNETVQDVKLSLIRPNPVSYTHLQITVQSKVPDSSVTDLESQAKMCIRDSNGWQLLVR